jgi:hypothetical protein
MNMSSENDPTHLNVDFEGDLLHSAASSLSDSDSDSGDSESTLDIDGYQFGHPLQRIFRVESTNENSMFRSAFSSPTCSSVSSSSESATSSSFYDTCVRASPIALA